MHRFFVNNKISLKDNVIITDENDVNHIKRALRVKIGEKLEVCDCDGKEFVVEVNAIDDVVSCTILSEHSVNRESDIQIDLFQGLPKGSKMETIIQKSVELGVHKIIPLMTKRAIVKLDDKSEKKKTERWQKIADEASKQSKRALLPEITALVDIKQIKSHLSAYDLILVAYELESEGTLKQIIKSNNATKIAVFIGPEGGFEESEIKLLVESGAFSVTLGPRILRTETAGPMLIGILQYELGDVSL